MIIFFILLMLSSIPSYLYYLYLYQLKGYYKIRYFKFVLTKKESLINFLLLALSLIINLSIFKLDTLQPLIDYDKITEKNQILFLLINSCFYLFYFIKNIIYLNKNKKIKFNVTFRIIRNILIYSVLLIILLIFNINLIYFIYLLFIFIPIIDLLDIYSYIQTLICKIKAKKYLKSNPSSIRIGITGSNGKTSIKNILYSLLKDDFVTIVTPKNFNTPKGLLYTITKLCNDKTECIIFEMGAKKVKDIHTLCKIAKPNFGILSNITKQHMETFKTIENVYNTKCELPIYLNNELCVFNYNDNLSTKAYLEKVGKKLIIGFISRHNKTIKQNKLIRIIRNYSSTLKYIRPFKLDIYAKNIHIKNGKTFFTLHIKNRSYRLSTKLLGFHNISNILQAVAIATTLNISMVKLKEKIKKLEPTPHRLQLIKNRINILDDSYNCSILSAKNSLEVLSYFKGSKICCTPGIIEGGSLQKELNIELAKMLEKYSDIQIIIGKTNRKYFETVLGHKKSVYYLDTLNEAKELFSALKSGDTLMLLNDLPDDYN